jgi:hypothetical protein
MMGDYPLQGDFLAKAMDRTRISFNIDQAHHSTCKLVWVLALFWSNPV